MAFYFGEIIALILCWLFYFEFRWVLERRMHKVCSNDFISKRCVTFSDKLFFTPVSGKVNFGALYYVNFVIFFMLLILSVFHLLFGWIEPVSGLVKLFTTLLMVFLGVIAVCSSAGGTDEICGELNITDKKNVNILKTVFMISELLVVLTYLYLAWVYIF